MRRASPILAAGRGPVGPGGGAGAPGLPGYSSLAPFTQPAALASVANITYTGTDPGIGAILDLVVSGSVAGRYLVTAQGGSRVTIQALSLGSVTEGATVGASVALHAGATGATGPAGSANISGTTGRLLKFTAATTGGDSIVSESGSALTVAGTHEVTGRARQRTTQGGGWKDLLGPLTPPNVGGTIPVVTQVAASPISLPLWQLNDKMWAQFHVGHDYALGTDVYFHVHWLTDGTQTRTVKWQVTFYYARGYNVEAFALGGAGTVITIEQAAAGVAYRHMISESAAQTIANMEPDGYVLVEIKRIVNGGTDNTDNVFAWNVDVHYQSVESSSANRNGPWNT